MQITIPVYVLQRRSRESSDSVEVRPLLHAELVVRSGDVGRAMNKLSQTLRNTLTSLAAQQRHDDLLRMHDERDFEVSTHKLHLDLRDGTADLKMLLVSAMASSVNTLTQDVFPREKVDYRVAFSPSLPRVWFEVQHGEQVADRAVEVFQDYFRQVRQDNQEYNVKQHGIEGRAWIDTITLDIAPNQTPKKEVDPLRALLGGEEISSGADELRKVGRCLSWLDDEELANPSGIDEDIERLTILMSLPDRPSIVLVGQRGSGKSARIEGAVRRRGQARRSRANRQVWQLSPARLISGMSYLGQWQQRVLAIWRHAYRRDHTLVFDDMLGLFEAGKTRDSSMSVADSLRTQMQSQPVRIVAEMTPEAWAIFRRRDPAFASRFTVVPTEAIDRERTLDIMIRVRRELEDRHACRFQADSLPQIVSLYDRFERESVLPGKAISAMKRLASTHERGEVTHEQVLEEFHRRSGIARSFLSERSNVGAEAVQSRIEDFVVSQNAAVEELVGQILVTASRLNDPARPLGVYLLVGPTGVGKTQLAKAVAEVMFDSGGLIRIDMNEMSSPTAAARLIGTPDSPDGVLTSAIRRRPNAVLLLDEIEKAHPSVLDILLPALGEARMSDARGRTVDLSGLLVLMTSNLGTSHSGRSVGFSGDNHQTIAATHMRAVRGFFRPEFFNRINGVLSFDPLSLETIGKIAKIQFEDVLRRDGLQRRGVLIECDDAVIEAAAAKGFDPRMGARALKRQIQRDVVRVASERLAGQSSEQPTLLQLSLSETGDLQVNCQPILWMALHGPSVDELDPPLRDVLAWADDKIGELSRQIDDAPIRFDTAQGVDSAALEVIALRDALAQCRDTRGAVARLLDVSRLDRPQATPVHAPRRAAMTSWSKSDDNPRGRRQDEMAFDDMNAFLDESLHDADPLSLVQARNTLIDEVRQLEAFCGVRGQASRYLLRVQILSRSGQRLIHQPNFVNNVTVQLAIMFKQWLRDDEDLSIEDVPSENEMQCCLVSGTFCAASIDELVGTWHLVRPDGDFSLVRVDAHPFVTDDIDLAKIVERPWDQNLAPVRRGLLESGIVLDRVTGLEFRQGATGDKLRAALTACRRRMNS